MEVPLFSLTPAHQRLLNCLHQDPARRSAIREASLSNADWNGFLSAAARHNVSALLFYRFKTEGVLPFLPEWVQQTFWDRYMRNSAWNVRRFFCLKELLKAFQAESIPVILLKGAHLACTVYENSSVREMSDIDLMVPTGKLRAADKVLLNLGYTPKSPSEMDFEIAHFAHLPQYNKPVSPAIELHWNISHPKPPCRFDVSRFWQDTEHFQVEGIDAQGLSPEWLLVHLCVHISHMHGFNSGLKGYCDIAEMLARSTATVNWQRLRDITLESGAKRGVYLPLFLAKELLGAHVPEETLDSLRPSSMHSQVVQLAQYQLLEKDPAKNCSEAGAEVLRRKGVWPKIGGMLRRVFLSRKALARIYGLDPNTWYTCLYYPVRLVDLIRDHKKIVWGYTRGDDDTGPVVQGVGLLKDWLSGK